MNQPPKTIRELHAMTNAEMQAFIDSEGTDAGKGIEEDLFTWAQKIMALRNKLDAMRAVIASVGHANTHAEMMRTTRTAYERFGTSRLTGPTYTEVQEMTNKRFGGL